MNVHLVQGACCNLLLQSIEEISVASGKRWQMRNRRRTLITIGFQQRSNTKHIKAKTTGWN
jgi:hypothetical protein